MFDVSSVNYSVSLDKIIKKFHLKKLTPDLDTAGIMIETVDVNRPALQFAGYFDEFDPKRIQLCGKVEYNFLELHDDDFIHEMTTRLFKEKIPCIIFCRGLVPNQLFMDLSRSYNVPLLMTPEGTSSFMGQLIRYLKMELAPRISIHGVLVDVFGEGILIMGESGIGKSEAALELIKRGHRLVSDDVVEIKKINEDELLGSAPEITRHFIELRGIGIIDVRTLYGVQSVEDTHEIDLIIKLEEWERDHEYDRLGLEDNYEEILGIRKVCHSLPIRPGRNLAIIVEAAAVNFRQKKMGYNAVDELYRRVAERNKREKQQAKS